MRQQTYKNVLLVLLALFTTTAIYAGARQEFSKKIVKNFSTTADGQVEIANKHGQVTINTWNSNDVKIEVLIQVMARNEGIAEKTFDRINIAFDNYNGFVSAKTEISESSSGSWWSDQVSSEGDFKINYEVYMPQSNRLNLYNKYGDTSVGVLDNAANIEVKYGALSMKDIAGELALIIGYGKANLGNMESLKLQMKYADLNMGQTKTIKAETKYSHIHLEKAQFIESISKYDNFEIGEVDELRNQGKYDHFKIGFINSLIATSRYSDFDVEQLNGMADLSMEYGGARFKSVSSNFSKISLVGDYTDYFIQMSAGANYVLDVEGEGHAGISYPQGLTIIHEEKDGGDHEVEGYYGEKNTAGIIKARLQHGGLKVKWEQ